MEDVEVRFAHLLQPIRDLTKNWEVDKAAQLDEYLEEVDQICISFDEGNTIDPGLSLCLQLKGGVPRWSTRL